jgi:hypothetical protein
MPVASLDHYIGREVLETIDTPEGWAIKLQGDIFIHNLVPEYNNPGDVLLGKSLQRVILSSTETVMYFGTDDNPSAVQVNLVPTQYGVVDQTRHGTDMKMPQVGPEVFEPPPEPVERLAKKPGKDAGKLEKPSKPEDKPKVDQGGIDQGGIDRGGIEA